MRFRLFLTCISLFSFVTVIAQQQPTSRVEIEKGYLLKAKQSENSIVKNLPFKNIGPSVMSGRVVDLAVNPENPIEFYVGYASGGVWYTKDNGISFESIFDNSPTQNVGCITVDWNQRIIWVGTGEVNASRSSYAGIGILKSTNQGATWEQIGLKDSHHISKIVVNPNNSNEMIVGVLGPLYSKSKSRGIYKTTDGGKTWSQTLYVNDEAGIVELEVLATDFNVMYAASWEKDRKAWDFKENGLGSGIYKSTDAGTSWTKVSTSESGFPSGEKVGRIGLSIADESTLYAILDNQELRKEESTKETKDELAKEDFKTMTREGLLGLENATLETYLRNNNFQKKYTAESVKKLVSERKSQPVDLAKYLEDENNQLFDTPVIGAEVYKSNDGGKTWNKTHEGYLDGVYYSYGYYFGKIHVDPSNKKAIYIYGVPILKSKDGGKTFTSMNADNVHSDHHALWINPKMPGHLIDGNDGGVNITFDDGDHWMKCNTPAVGQFYSIQVDNAAPYNVYGGLQDNGVWVGPHDHEEGVYWQHIGDYPYKMILGGDGMQVQVDSRDHQVVYAGYQFGNYYRVNRNTDESKYIQPKHELGDTPYRFNWQTPILLSKHNQDILYMGGNKLMRSMNQGDDWEAISPDLTVGGKPGNVSYGTLTCLSESPFQFGLMYTGSDDGLVYLTQNGGGDWKNVSNSFPKDLWVSRVVASQHEEPRVYVTLNGYRWDDFTPYVYLSDDFGATWKSISNNLPSSPVNVIAEDTENEHILYLGTDNGVYVSFDRGGHWEPFSEGLPNVAVHDLVVQSEAKDLILGTHGRSLYIADISLLQQLNASNSDDLLLNTIAPVRFSRRWGNSWNPYSNPREPTVSIQYYSPKSGMATLKITSEEGVNLLEWKVESDRGINVTETHLVLSDQGVKHLKKNGVKISESGNGLYYLPKGTYQLEVQIASNKASTTLEIK